MAGEEANGVFNGGSPNENTRTLMEMMETMRRQNGERREERYGERREERFDWFPPKLVVSQKDIVKDVNTDKLLHFPERTNKIMEEI